MIERSSVALVGLRGTLQVHTGHPLACSKEKMGCSGSSVRVRPSDDPRIQHVVVLVMENR